LKTIVLQMPAEPLDSSLRNLVVRMRVSLARAAESPMEISDTERLVREAHELRTAFLRGATPKK
jgi:hypothetical protein